MEQLYTFREKVFPPKLVEYLKTNGFFTAPASAGHHLAYPGGLFEHSCHVAQMLTAFTAENYLKWERPESPYIIGMMHDLCKIDTYIKLDEPDEKGRLYRYNTDTELKGHGDKSAILLARFMPLTAEEDACIRYHMGAFTTSDLWHEYTDAIHRFPNVLWTHQADMYATHIMEI